MCCRNELSSGVASSVVTPAGGAGLAYTGSSAGFQVVTYQQALALARGVSLEQRSVSTNAVEFCGVCLAGKVFLGAVIAVFVLSVLKGN